MVTSLPSGCSTSTGGDRLVSISRPGMATNAFAYNGLGVRVSKSDSSGSNSYLRASAGLIGAIVSDSGATYTPGVSEKRGTTSTFYHADIKSSVEQTDSSGHIVSSQQYDAFGNVVSSGGGTWNGPFAYGGRFGYQSDGDYGLKHLGARYYDPTAGRFLSRDPIRDGRNWYAYARSRPLVHVDPIGLIGEDKEAWLSIADAVFGFVGECFPARNKKNLDAGGQWWYPRRRTSLPVMTPVPGV